MAVWADIGVGGGATDVDDSMSGFFCTYICYDFYRKVS